MLSGMFVLLDVLRMMWCVWWNEYFYNKDYDKSEFLFIKIVSCFKKGIFRC